MLNVEKTILDELDSLLKLSYNFKDKLSSDNYLFIASDRDTTTNADSIECANYFRLPLIPNITSFDILYIEELESMKDLISKNFIDFVINWEKYFKNRIAVIYKFEIINLNNKDIYSDYIDDITDSFNLQFKKKEKPLFDTDSDLGLFFFRYICAFNSIIAELTKLSRVSQSLYTRILENVCNNNISGIEENTQYLINIFK